MVTETGFHNQLLFCLHLTYLLTSVCKAERLPEYFSQLCVQSASVSSHSWLRLADDNALLALRMQTVAFGPWAFTTSRPDALNILLSAQWPLLLPCWSAISSVQILILLIIINWHLKNAQLMKIVTKAAIWQENKGFCHWTFETVQWHRWMT